jgi:branched-subunit amino acid aminotransferase/4-amino-4-deoxychorismate lyase
VRTFGAKPFRLADHLARLKQSLEVIDIDPGVPTDELDRVARELVARNHRLLQPADDQGLSIFVTPGTYRSYASGDAGGPTVCLHTYPLPFALWASKYEHGQALVTTDVRQVPPECWPPNLKCRSRMHYYLADHRAEQIEPGSRALLQDLDGRVTEASTANILIYRRDEGLVAPPTAKVLPGISLKAVVELGSRIGIDECERDLRVEDVASADEVMLTSTPFALLPVTRLNGRPVGDGKPGEVYRELLRAFSEQVGVDVAAQARRFAGREWQYGK